MASTREKTKRVIEQSAKDSIHGLGDDVVRIANGDDQTICHIGLKDEQEQVHFAKPVTLEQLEEIVELLHKKKFQRYMNDGKIIKAQSFADRKFGV